ncbi:MAG: DNA repair protein RecN [Actinomycetota bacterium]
MRIQGLGVIENAELELGSGLNVLTGETGAGKTMVVTGLLLLLGGRSDPAAVRAGHDIAFIEGHIELTTESMRRRVADIGGKVDDEVVLLSRSVTAQGRSRAHVGGRAVPVSALGGLAADLVLVHGQSGQIQLTNVARQRHLLDVFAGNADLVSQVTQVHEELNLARRRLIDFHASAAERDRQAEVFQLGLSEIAAVSPQPGEDQALRKEAGRLGRIDQIRTAVEQAHRSLQLPADDVLDMNQTDIVTLVADARRALDPVTEHDRVLSDVDTRLVEITHLAAELATDLASYLSQVDADPQRLAIVQERRAALTGLMRRYGPNLIDVLSWQENAQEQLPHLTDNGGEVHALQSEYDRLQVQLADMTGELSRSRSAAAQRLSAAVTAELTELAMPHASFMIEVSQEDASTFELLDGNDEGGDATAPERSEQGTPFALDVMLGEKERRVKVGRHGADEVTFMLVPHAGSSPRPLSRAASGGELSRIMLALHVVLAGADPVPTIIFDEVDAGVGGKAAVEIGRRLARLSRDTQVLVVTHLPQVAAFADHHLAVKKGHNGGITQSEVQALTEEERVTELARMLAGQENSVSAHLHARELREGAAAERKSD